MTRKYTIPVLVFLILLGVVLAFDRRFVSLSELRHKPAMAVYIYAPTGIFAIIGAVQLLRGRFWQAVAFAIGLIGTGLYHQNVIGMSHENPGYMFPGGHILAPFVSVVAYSLSLLGAWIVVRTSQRRSGINTKK